MFQHLNCNVVLQTYILKTTYNMDLKHANVSKMTPYFICWQSATILSSASIIMGVFPISHSNNIREGIITCCSTLYHQHIESLSIFN